MMCWTLKRQQDDYLDGRLRPVERLQFEAHLQRCESCAVGFEQARSLRASMVGLPDPPVPAELKDRLRVQASLARQVLDETHGSRLQFVWNRWKSRLDEIMRPVTIPATGGLLSSLLLFGALAFTIGTRSAVVGYEVPLVYAEHADVNLVPVELRSSVVLTLSLDSNGRIINYAVRDGSASFVGDTSRMQSDNISLPEFSNILALARPVTRDVSISFTPIVFRP